MKVYIVVKCFVERDGCPSENEAVFRSREDAEAAAEYWGSTSLAWHMNPSRSYEVEEWEVK